MFICMLFLIFWLLPNGRVSWRQVLPVSVVVGLTLEAVKYQNILVWPFLRRKLQQEYGPFYCSVSVILISFFGAMIILAGAESLGRSKGTQAAETESEQAAEVTA
jgi:membrane protein